MEEKNKNCVFRNIKKKKKKKHKKRKSFLISEKEKKSLAEYIYWKNIL